MVFIESNESYLKMLPALNQARFGAYIIFPFQFQDDEFHLEWTDKTFCACDVDTIDLNETIRAMMSRSGRSSIGCCWKIPGDVLLREMSDKEWAEAQTFYVDRKNSRRTFSLTDSWLYVFHSHTAFLALGLYFDEIETFADIVDLGGVASLAAFSYQDGAERVDFSLSDWVDALAQKIGIRNFYSRESNPFTDVFTYALALVPEPFPDLDSMKQATFNIHLTISFSNPIMSNSEEDVRFVYAKINEITHTFRWATCVTSQTISYIVADPDMDLRSEMESQGLDGLPVVMLALYEKYTCLSYTEAIVNTDIQHLKSIQKMKMEMLEFKAYGTVAPANISRWNNIREIYRGLLETNDIPRAIDDVNHKIGILAEHQRELEAKKSEMLTNLITVFGIISILASVLTIIQLLLGGNNVLWISLVLTVIAIFLIFLLTVFRGRK